MPSRQQYILEIKKDMAEAAKWHKPLPCYITDVIKKHGPQETSYCCEVPTEDQYWLQRYFMAMRQLPDFPPNTGHWEADQPQVKDYFDELERIYNDHKSPRLLNYHGRQINITKVSKARDLPSLIGLAYMVRTIADLEATTLYRYIGVGSDNREPRFYHQKLYAEVTPRMDMTNGAQGSKTRLGQSLRFIGLFPSTQGTVTAKESGVSNVTDNSGTFLNRNMFDDDPIVHTVNVAAFNLATIIAFASVLSWE